MAINKNQIPIREFVKNEINTLGKIQGYSPIVQNFPNLSASAGRYYNMYQGKYKKAPATEFEFKSEMRIPIEGKNRSIFIEACILNNYSLSTYALSICDTDGKDRKLLRKFHFDYDPNQNSAVDKKPFYHLQYAGKATPLLEENEISTEPLYDWLSVPRLFYSPVNLALLLDAVFNEFPSEITYKIIEKDEWRQMIKNNEDIILKPYFQNISDFLSRDHKSTSLFRDFAYGQ